MAELMDGRQFQLWEYHVSHGSLLIRSPAGPDVETSIDIICTGVEYLAAPRHLGEIRISEPTDVEIARLAQMVGKEVPPARVWVLQGSHERFSLVAASLKVQEHHGDIFESPFRL